MLTNIESIAGMLSFRTVRSTETVSDLPVFTANELKGLRCQHSSRRLGCLTELPQSARTFAYVAPNFRNPSFWPDAAAFIEVAFGLTVVFQPQFALRPLPNLEGPHSGLACRRIGST